MCEFCRNPLQRKGFEDDSPCLVKTENEDYEVYFHGLYEEYYKIAFCPMCGRKLVEE